MRGKNLRIIAPSAGIFLHTVREGDRLDLLGYKYYGDSVRWWQICDANPQFPFPTDLLDRNPIVEELWALTNPGYESRLQALLAAFAALAQVKLFAAGLVSSSVTLAFAAAPARANILAAIADGGFRLLRSFAWADAGSTIETFTIEDAAAKMGWRRILETLLATPGVVKLESAMTDASVRLTYNSALVRREDLLAQLKTGGFDLIPQLVLKLERPGAKIIVPPNAIV